MQRSMSFNTLRRGKSSVCLNLDLGEVLSWVTGVVFAHQHMVRNCHLCLSKASLVDEQWMAAESVV